ncbi:MAG: ABC transporter substrate-binding protein [Streptosporangiales bacterium]|nr:ABC transporter substrate-binding protein [Streptosporangiales bacterium]
MASVARRFLTAAVVVAAAVFTGCGGDDGAPAGGGGGDTGTIKYGLISAFSGSTASWGTAEKAAVELGIEEVNKTGIKVDDTTYKFELLTYDSAYDPTKAASAAQEALTKDNVQFLENLGAGTVAAVQPLTERRNVLLICACGGDTFLGEEHLLTFRPYFDVPTSLKASLTYLQESDPNAKKLAMIYPDDEAGHTNAERSEQYARELGFETQMHFIDRSTQDLAPLMTKVLNGDPDAVDVGPSPEALYIGIVKEGGQQGFNGPYIFPDVLHFETTIDATGPKPLQASLSSPCQLEPTTDVAKNFASAFEEKAGMEVQWWAAQNYDAVRLLAKAIEEAQSLDTKAVAEVLGGDAITVDGATAGGAPSLSYGTVVNGLPRAFDVPYPVCEVKGGKLIQATTGS